MRSSAFSFFPRKLQLHIQTQHRSSIIVNTLLKYVFGIIMSGTIKSSASRVAGGPCVLLCNPKQFQSNSTSPNADVLVSSSRDNQMGHWSNIQDRTCVFSIQATGLKPEQARSCCCCHTSFSDMISTVALATRHGSGKQTPKRNCWLFLVRVITARLIGAHSARVS